MADPFEVRVRFSSQLQNLNASVTSAKKAAAYALKHRDLDEDLHSCILEQLEKTPVNTRANIMYFIEHFLELAQREGHNEYVAMMQRDIIRVVDAVAPENGQGAANVKVVRRVLQGLRQRGFLDNQVVTQIEEVLRDRETDLLEAGGNDEVVDGDHPAGAMDLDSHMPPSQTIPAAAHERNGHGHGHGHGHGDMRAGVLAAVTGTVSSAPSAPSAPRRLDRKQIEERIEEDRERHKRLRENIWAVPSGADAEMWKMWEETSDLGEDDHLMGEEEQAERARNMWRSCTHRGEAETANGRHGETARMR